MIQEVKVKFYNKELGVGYDDFRKVFSEKENTWYKVEVHAGRLVYGRSRKPFKVLREGVTNKNFIIRQFFPF